MLFFRRQFEIPNGTLTFLSGYLELTEVPRLLSLKDKRLNCSIYREMVLFIPVLIIAAFRLYSRISNFHPERDEISSV